MISIITVNYNGYTVTCDLIESIRVSGFQGEVIVVDNGSGQNQARMLKDRYPEIITIRSESNLGFAGGNNLGIERATGDVLFFLNNDTTLSPGFDKAIERFMDENQAVGAFSPKICFEYAPDTIQFAGYTPLSYITMRNHLIGYRCKDEGQYDVAQPIPYLHGAAMAVRRQVIEDAGMIPDCYFLYYEELDWSIRITQAGYHIWYAPVTVVYHKESWTTGKMSPMKAYYLSRNRFVFARRNLKGLNRICSVCYQMFVSAPINVFRSLKNGNPKIAGVIIKSVFTHWAAYRKPNEKLKVKNFFNFNF